MPCPFPDRYGGKERCGVCDEDGADEVLMASCAAVAMLDNRALSADEIAAIAFEQGWLRPPSAAIEPAAVINTSIRSHLKRCEKSEPVRPPLLAKHQLAGSVVESALEPALHPDAFARPIRPKGTVWFLSHLACKAKWKNPFDGLEVPKAPPRKLAPKIKPQPAKEKASKTDSDKEGKSKTKTKSSKSTPSVKIRLVVGAGQDEESDSSRSRSQSTSRDVTPVVVQPAPRRPRASSRMRNILDDSSDSDTSDSDMDLDPGPSVRPVLKPRKSLPPPLSLSSTFPTIRSTFQDLFQSFTPTLPTFNSLPHTSPFPSHSLDNTTWTARHGRFDDEDSTSSSGDETRAEDWGMASGIMSDGDKSPDDEDENKVKEATDALRVLFNIPQSEQPSASPVLDLARLTASDTSSIADSTSTARAQGFLRDHLRVPFDVAPALAEWGITSSPALPHLSLPDVPPQPQGSPCEHLPRLAESFDPNESSVEPPTWLDEDGELPVKAEDALSDIELGSNVGDLPPEHDKQYETAAWAQDAADAMHVKQEPFDYASPLSTVPDDSSAMAYGSRASTESRSPSSGSSELPELDSINGSKIFEEVMIGPESVTLEELDELMPSQGKTDKTPARGRKNRPLTTAGVWGCIGVGSFHKLALTPKISRKKSVKSKRPDSPDPVSPEEMDIDPFEGAIGTEDLEAAWAEANARVEQDKKESKVKAEHAKAVYQAWRQQCKGITVTPDSAGPDQPSPFSDLTTPFGSSDSLQLATPGVLSPMMLQNMSGISGLSLVDLPGFGVDPKALKSPPLAAVSLEDLQAQAEVEAVISIKTPSPAPPPADVKPTLTPSPVKQQPPADNATLAVPPTAVPRPASAASTDSKLSSVPSAPSERATTPAKTAAAAAPAPASTPSASSTTSAPSGSAPPRARPGAFRSICPGLDACVVNQIPVYSHHYNTPQGKVGIVLRRVDTDFVNATALLNALSVPSTKHREIIHAPGSSIASHKTMQQKNQNGVFYAPGVCGVWVPLAEAQKYVGKVVVPEGSQVTGILRNDLFSIFAAMAGVTFAHSASDTFGPLFATDDPTSHPQPHPPVNSSQSSLVSSSSANSKSTPDLSSLKTPSSALAKGPLIRPAPATPPDGAPQPKRRRATVVGELSPLATTAAKPGLAAGKKASPPAAKKEAPARKARASIAGDVVKPKVGPA